MNKDKNKEIQKLAKKETAINQHLQRIVSAYLEMTGLQAIMEEGGSIGG